jgi:hypothetical protein
MATVAFMKSCLDLKEALMCGGVSHEFLFTSNESLIQRARNTSVATFLKTGYQKLLFIDADIDFTPEDVSKLWNMETDVAVGAYSMKRPDKPVSAWKDGKVVDLKDLKEVTEVDYAGTGFMMIDRSVFEKMQKAFPELDHEEGKVGECHGWFHCPIKGRTQMSEDYEFCNKWREMGGKVLLDPTISLGHWGTFRYGN